MKRDYKAVLERPAPPPDPQARLRARRAALEEFARVQAAAVDVATPAATRTWTSWSRNLAMAAGICVAVIGLAISWPMLNQNPELLEPRMARDVVAPSADVPDVASESPPEVSGSADAAPVQAAPPVVAEVPAPARSPAPQSGPVSRDLPMAESQTEVVEEAVVAQHRSELEPVTGSGSVPASSAQPGTIERVGKLPEANVAEAFQRVPAIKLERTRTPAVKNSERDMSDVVVTGARRAARTSPNKSAATPPAPPPALRGDVASRRWGYADAPNPPPYEEAGRDRFEDFESNAVKLVSEAPVSTFSADVDTASYSFVRKQLTQGLLPQKDAVRVEEMINYFDYSWPAAASRDEPFRPTVVVSDSPWGEGRKLIHVGIKGYELPERQRPDVNLVLLIDVSGSMNAPDKLPLVRDSMRLLVDNLKPDDTVGIVVYAGAAGLVLPPTRVKEKEKILEAIARLTPGGSTAGADGIRLAYDLAERSFRKDGVNRILLATDGDFNVGIDSTAELQGYVERKRERGVFLSVLGYGQGNYRDELAQALAQNGNGVAAYIDTLNEAHKVLVQQAGSSLVTIAKDVKLQVEFNPATVAEYRLVGYETRALRREDFNNDAVDAGDVGAGHTVTAIYEITPVATEARAVDGLRYAPAEKSAVRKETANEYGFLKIRYKLPNGRKSRLIEQPIRIDAGKVPEAIARDVAFSTAVAGFGQLLRGGEHIGELSYDDVARAALASRGEDPFGYRNEFVQLVRKAQSAKGM